MSPYRPPSIPSPTRTGHAYLRLLPVGACRIYAMWELVDAPTGQWNLHIDVDTEHVSASVLPVTAPVGGAFVDVPSGATVVAKIMCENGGGSVQLMDAATISLANHVPARETGAQATQATWIEPSGSRHERADDATSPRRAWGTTP